MVTVTSNSNYKLGQLEPFGAVISGINLANDVDDDLIDTITVNVGDKMHRYATSGQGRGDGLDYLLQPSAAAFDAGL